MQRFLRRVAVIGGVRIPFCRSNTFYADLSNLDMMTGALNALVERYNLKGQHIDEVIGGSNLMVLGNRDRMIVDAYENLPQEKKAVDLVGLMTHTSTHARQGICW